MNVVVPPRSPALGSFVDYLGYFEGPRPPHARERILPTGSVDLLVGLADDVFHTYNDTDGTSPQTVPAVVLGGPTGTYRVVATGAQRSVVCVHFWTGGALPFFPAPLSTMRDSLVCLDELWGRGGVLLRDQVLDAPTPEAKLEVVEAALLAHVTRPLERDPAVDGAVAALARGGRVQDVVDCFGTTAKPFIRRFSEQVGLTPKRFARVRRLQRVLWSIPCDRPVDWAELAASHGYYDQPHFVHDFHALTGIPPSAYRPRSPNEVNHVPL